MTRTRERNCSGCRYWSEMLAQVQGGGSVEAMCLAASGVYAGTYVFGNDSCGSYAKNTAGAVDDPPDYSEAARAAYEGQAAMKHDNGAAMFAPDGTLLDEKGNRSIFDDVDE